MKRSPIRRHRPIRRTGAKRASEWARIYGSKARVAWIKAQPCVVCGAGPCENAHTETGGMGRKAGYETIVPLCGRASGGSMWCHRAYDEHVPPLDDPKVRAYVKACAAQIERAWQGRQT